MTDQIGQALTHISKFVKLHRIEPGFHFHTVDQLRRDSEKQSSYWARFEKKAGVYCFFGRNERGIVYIGMSRSDTGTRLFRWLFKDNKLSDDLEGDDVILSVVLDEQSYMAPALESFLIEKLEPARNVHI